MSIHKVKRALKRFNRFIISAHINPEGDSIGGQLAIASLLKRLGKDARIVNESPVPQVLRFMKGTDLILNKLPEDFDFEAAIVLDCPDMKRIGFMQRRFWEQAFTLLELIIVIIIVGVLAGLAAVIPVD